MAPSLPLDARLARIRFNEELSRLKERELENRNREERGLNRQQMDHLRLVDHAVAYARAFPEAISAARQEVRQFDARVESAMAPGSQFANAAVEAGEWLGYLSDFFAWPWHTAGLIYRLANHGQIASGKVALPDGQPIGLFYPDIEAIRRNLEQLIDFDGNEWSRRTASGLRFTSPFGPGLLRRWHDETVKALSKLRPDCEEVDALRTLLRLHDVSMSSEQTERVIDLDMIHVNRHFPFDDYVVRFELAVRWLEAWTANPPSFLDLHVNGDTVTRDGYAAQVALKRSSKARIVFDVLCAARENGLTRQDLFDAVWADEPVQPNDLSQQISTLKRELAELQVTIRHNPYRLTAL